MMDDRAMSYLPVIISALEKKATLSKRKLRARVYTVAALATVFCLFVVIPFSWMSDYTFWLTC